MFYLLADGENQLSSVPLGQCRYKNCNEQGIYVCHWEVPPNQNTQTNHIRITGESCGLKPTSCHKAFCPKHIVESRLEQRDSYTGLACGKLFAVKACEDCTNANWKKIVRVGLGCQCGCYMFMIAIPLIVMIILFSVL